MEKYHVSSLIQDVFSSGKWAVSGVFHHRYIIKSSTKKSFFF